MMSPRRLLPLAFALVVLTGCASLPPPSELPPCVSIDVPSLTFDFSPYVLPRAEGNLGRDIWLLQPEAPDGINVALVPPSQAAAPATVRVRSIPFLRLFRPLFVLPNNAVSLPGHAWAASRACVRAGLSECTIPPGTYRVRIRYLAQRDGARVLCDCSSRSFRVERPTEFFITQ